MAESRKYGVQSISGDFDRRGVAGNPGQGFKASYKAGERDTGGGQSHYAKGDRSSNSRGSANYVTQKKGQGMTGSGHGSGRNGFGKPAGSTGSFASGGGNQRKGFGGQKKGK